MYVPIVILLRTGNSSLFRGAITLLAKVPGEKLFLSSGYLNHNIASSPRLIEAIGDGFHGFANSQIITVGGMFEGNPHNQERYNKFVYSLRQANFSVRQYFSASGKWHAKVAVKLRDGRPVAAVIGSSNLTKAAFCDGGKERNQECDVLIYEQDVISVDSLDAVLRGNYVLSQPINVDEEDLLSDLLDGLRDTIKEERLTEAE